MNNLFIIFYCFFSFSTYSFCDEDYLVKAERVLIEAESIISQDPVLESLFQGKSSNFNCQEDYCSQHGHVASSPCQGSGEINLHQCIIAQTLNKARLQQYYDSYDDLIEGYSKDNILATDDDINDFIPLYKLQETRKTIKRKIRKFLRNYQQVIQTEKARLAREHSEKIKQQEKKKRSNAVVALTCCGRFQCHRSCCERLHSSGSKCPSCSKTLTEEQLKEDKKNFVPNSKRKEQCWICLDALKTEYSHSIQPRPAKDKEKGRRKKLSKDR